MKKSILVLLVVCLLIPTVSAWAENNGVLNVYNWGEYIDKQVLTDFEKAYNCRVTYSVFESNEDMYTKLLSGASYDVLVPSDYMIERLIKEKKLQALDHSVITNMSGLTDAVRNLYFDPDNTYSVPYFWQTIGIVYDTTKISPEEMEEQGWNAFLNPKYKGHVYVWDSERDTFMMALKALGYSANTSDPAELEAAYNWLREMDKTVNPSYVTDEATDAMIYGEKWIALMYSGDAANVLYENEDMSYCTPKQGTNVAFDCMVIPANATNPELANLFINFILEYKQSKMISEEVGYASPNAQVLEELSSEGGKFEGNVAYIPRSGCELDEFYHDIPEDLRSQYSSMYIKVKLHE